MNETLQSWAEAMEATPFLGRYTVTVLMGVLAIALSALANFVAKRLILGLVARLVHRSQNTWDDVFLRRNTFAILSHLAPIAVLHIFAPFVLGPYPQVLAFFSQAISLYVLVIGVLVVNSVLDAGVDIYRRFDVSRDVPIRGFVQVVKIILFATAGIFVFSLVAGRSPLYFLSGLGAMTAVLMLIFKDVILGLVAGVQLAANRMVARGDWISMPAYGADGDVLEINLTTVKVQNWDKTISTIPTYALISDPVKNWRGMEESGGRRIKRSIHIDMGTIRFCTDEMLGRYARIEYIKEYIAEKEKELAASNEAIAADETIAEDEVVNRRHLTNVGTFRAYVVGYLRNHPKVSDTMTFLVRQLPPTETGLPIEVYVFVNDTRWVQYEAVQADIFDHLLAVAPEFDLRVFQNPTGHDIAALGADPANAEGSRGSGRTGQGRVL